LEVIGKVSRGLPAEKQQSTDGPQAKTVEDGLACLSRSDQYFELTLRVLMLCVAAALPGCVAFLGYRWAQPARADPSLVQLVQAPAPAVAVPRPAPLESSRAQVLRLPGSIFLCTVEGRVTFSNQPCRETTRPRQ
jgi:hypothetical protein